MGKYSKTFHKEPPPRVKGVNPIMKGFGCFFMILIPPLSYAIAALLVQIGAQQRWPLPPEWLGYVKIHPLLWQLEGLAPIFAFLERQVNLTANLVFAFGIMVAISGLMSIFFGYLNKLVGPSTYGPTDVPPIRIKTKRYKR
ncbi:MAG: hypothetical protein HS124_05425 [Anaerolineales bacterium]|nr:hypothetical protein [Anaerolineales bacterium]MCL4259299.1 hypothetical protein [Anaerolineales bacterium]GJQ52086.1 MAG: hypothetical protein HKUEN02_09330 [Anaerolineaceae bacterium]